MNDMRSVIVPKSDQLNADDLIAGPLTVDIRDVTIKPGEQPVSIYFDGDGDKPYKCCKSMARVLVYCWGDDATQYVGKSMTLYRDPAVKWGGMAVGGIRISHMSHIKGKQTMALTETRGSKKLFTVLPLDAGQTQNGRPSEKQQAEQQPDGPPEDAPWIDKVTHALLIDGGVGARWMGRLDAALVACPTMDDLAAIKALSSVAGALKNAPPHIRSDIDGKFQASATRLAPVEQPTTEAPAEDDGWPGPSTEAA